MYAEDITDELQVVADFTRSRSDAVVLLGMHAAPATSMWLS
jgi:hypothetical protein